MAIAYHTAEFKSIIVLKMSFGGRLPNLMAANISQLYSIRNRLEWTSDIVMVVYLLIKACHLSFILSLPNYYSLANVRLTSVEVLHQEVAFHSTVLFFLKHSAAGVFMEVAWSECWLFSYHPLPIHHLTSTVREGD